MINLRIFSLYLYKLKAYAYILDIRYILIYGLLRVILELQMILG